MIGIFDFGNKGVNERNVYVALRTAQNLLDLAGGATSLDVKVRDPFAAEMIAQAIRDSGDLHVDSWISTNAQFFSAMAAQILANTLIRIFVGHHRRARHRQRARRVGRAEIEGDRHPAGDGHRARPGAARVPDPGRLHGARRARSLGSLLAWGFLLLWRGVAKNPDGTPLFIVVIEPSLFALACVAATLVGILAAVVPARRAARARSGGGDPWLKRRRAKRCVSRRAQVLRRRARRSRSRSCTASTSCCGRANSRR